MPASASSSSPPPKRQRRTAAASPRIPSAAAAAAAAELELKPEPEAELQPEPGTDSEPQSDSSPGPPRAVSVTYGALSPLVGGSRGKGGHRRAQRLQLVAYDVFCMVFLDRPGCYYKRDQYARLTRSRIESVSVTADEPSLPTAEFIVTSLRRYHQRLPAVRGKPSVDGHIRTKHLSAWWWAEKSTRREVIERDPGYDWSHATFVRHFYQQDEQTTEGRARESQFFRSLRRYVALLLSEDVEVRPVDELLLLSSSSSSSSSSSPSPFCHGVFARRPLSGGRAGRGQSAVTVNVLAALSGELVNITKKEQKALLTGGAHHSVMHLPRKDLSRAAMPDGSDSVAERDQRSKRRASLNTDKRAVKQPPPVPVSTANKLQCFIVGGGISFINHACAGHSNAQPCVYANDNDKGAGQWKVVSLTKQVRKGEQLCLDYTGGARQQPYKCAGCLADTRSGKE